MSWGVSRWGGNDPAPTPQQDKAGAHKHQQPPRRRFPKLGFFCLTGESLHFIHTSIYVLIWSSSLPCPNLKDYQDIVCFFFAAIMLEFINRKAVCETHALLLQPRLESCIQVWALLIKKVRPQLARAQRAAKGVTRRKRRRKQPLRRGGGKWVNSWKRKAEQRWGSSFPFIKGFCRR